MSIKRFAKEIGVESDAMLKYAEEEQQKRDKRIADSQEQQKKNITDGLKIRMENFKATLDEKQKAEFEKIVEDILTTKE